MHRGIGLWLASIVFGSTMPAFAQAAKAPNGPVNLQPAAAAPNGVAVFPLVAPGDAVTAEVATKVNAGLARLNASVAKAAANCRKNVHATQHKPEPDAWTRSINVTMRGPRYLSMVANDSFDCGGMYPNSGILLPIVYDLTSGSPVSWLKYLPSGVTSALSDSGDGAKLGVVSWPALTKRSFAGASAECKDYFTDDSGVHFVLWLNALAGTLVAQPYDFPHAVAACANEVDLTVDEARKMGVHGDVLDALDAAKKLQ